MKPPATQTLQKASPSAPPTPTLSLLRSKSHFPTKSIKPNFSPKKSQRKSSTAASPGPSKPSLLTSTAPSTSDSAAPTQSTSDFAAPTPSVFDSAAPTPCISDSDKLPNLVWYRDLSKADYKWVEDLLRQSPYYKPVPFTSLVPENPPPQPPPLIPRAPKCAEAFCVQNLSP